MTTDGGINVEITSTKTDDLESPESPIIPSVIGEKTSYTSGSQNSGSGSENENPSADDERSRDGDRQRKLDDDQEASSSNLVDCTPRTRKKVEHFRQGLAARRIQRTWKHFYEELEERKEVRDELPAPLVQGNFRQYFLSINFSFLQSYKKLPKVGKYGKKIGKKLGKIEKKVGKKCQFSFSHWR